MAEQQLQIDFTRSEQIGLLRDVIMYPVELIDYEKKIGTGVRIKPDKLKAVLKSIDGFGRNGRNCYARQERIAFDIGASKRTVIRAIAALEQIGVIACQRLPTGSGRTTANHYAILWHELAQLDRRQKTCHSQPTELSKCQAVTLISDYQSDTLTDQSAMPTYQSDTLTNQSAKVSLCLIPSIPILSPSNRDGWAEVEKKYFGKIGMLTELIDKAQRLGESPEQFSDRVAAAYRTAEDPLNRSKIVSLDGVVANFLKSGCWPKGISSASELGVALERVDRSREKAINDQKEKFFYATVTTGRRIGSTYEQILAQLKTQLNDEDLKKRGWST